MNNKNHTKDLIFFAGGISLVAASVYYFYFSEKSKSFKSKPLPPVTLEIEVTNLKDFQRKLMSLVFNLDQSHISAEVLFKLQFCMLSFIYPFFEKQVRKIRSFQIFCKII